MTRTKPMWALAFLASYAESVVGLAIAAALLPEMALSVAGAAEAALILAVWEWMAFIPLRWMKRADASPWRVPIALFVLCPALMTLGLVLAVVVVPGLAISGFWAFVAADVIIFAVTITLGSLSDKALPSVPVEP